ncbi:MAG: lipopolysaccharide biosynthesis protein, partial [Ktedonobacteraceae bacterium]
TRHFLLVTIASVLVNRLDVVLVSSLSNVQVAGVYAAGARLAQVALMVALAVNIVLSPRIARAYRQGDGREVRRLFRSGLAFTVPIAVIEIALATVLGSDIVRIFGPSYATAAAPFAWVTVAYALWALAAPGYALLAMTGSERVVAALSWLVLIANVVTIILLVPSHGAAGAGMAMIAGYGLALLALFGALSRRKGMIIFGKIG